MKLGYKHIWRGHGRKRKYKRVDENMTYIPLPLTLQKMLDDKAILEAVCDTFLL